VRQQFLVELLKQFSDASIIERLCRGGPHHMSSFLTEADDVCLPIALTVTAVRRADSGRQGQKSADMRTLGVDWEAPPSPLIQSERLILAIRVGCRCWVCFAAVVA
jgi:hypothetical protein